MFKALVVVKIPYFGLVIYSNVLRSKWEKFWSTYFFLPRGGSS
jgi:hypothetical protein